MQINVALDRFALAQSVAKQVTEDGVRMPLCLSERTHQSVNDFCHVFYTIYEHGLQAKNLHVPDIQHVVHTVNLSAPGSMTVELDEILSTLHRYRYEPDAYITFSDGVFELLDSVSGCILYEHSLMLCGSEYVMEA